MVGLGIKFIADGGGAGMVGEGVWGGPRFAMCPPCCPPHDPEPPARFLAPPPELHTVGVCLAPARAVSPGYIILRVASAPPRL